MNVMSTLENGISSVEVVEVSELGDIYMYTWKAMKKVLD